MKKEHFIESVKKKYDYTNSLIRKRNALKKAVVQSNAITEVKIGNKKYTVTEAIEMKNHGMKFYQYLQSVMIRQLEIAEKENSQYI